VLKPAEPEDDGGWKGGIVERIDFGGDYASGVLTLEVRGMKPGPGTGANGTTGSGNHPERFLLEMFGPQVDKVDCYTMHKGRNAVRTNCRSKDRSVAYQSHNANTHGDRPEPIEWRWEWHDGKLWIYAGNELLKDYPRPIGPMRFAGCHIGGTDRSRPFEGQWRNATFEKGDG